MMNSRLKAKVLDWLIVIGALAFVAALVGWAVWYSVFYWGHCAWTPILEQPGLCHLSRGH